MLGSEDYRTIQALLKRERKKDIKCVCEQCVRKPEKLCRNTNMKSFIGTVRVFHIGHMYAGEPGYSPSVLAAHQPCNINTFFCRRYDQALYWRYLANAIIIVYSWSSFLKPQNILTLFNKPTSRHRRVEIYLFLKSQL